MTSDQLLEELGTMLGRCVKVIRELETENAELKARREWVGLTDEERQQILDTTHPDNRWTLAERVEYRLKEKNNG